MKLTYSSRLKIVITYSWKLNDTLSKKCVSAIDDTQITNRNQNDISYIWYKINSEIPNINHSYSWNFYDATSLLPDIFSKQLLFFGILVTIAVWYSEIILLSHLSTEFSYNFNHKQYFLLDFASFTKYIGY